VIECGVQGGGDRGSIEVSAVAGLAHFEVAARVGAVLVVLLVPIRVTDDVILANWIDLLVFQLEGFLPVLC